MGKSIFNSIGKIFGEWFRGNRIPTFLVYFDSTIKLAEQKVATAIELLDVFWLHLIGVFIELKYFSLRPFCNIFMSLFPIVVTKLILVGNDFLSDLDGDKCIVQGSTILTIFNLMHFKVHLVFRVILERILSPIPPSLLPILSTILRRLLSK